MKPYRFTLWCIVLITLTSFTKMADWLPFESNTCKILFPVAPKIDSSEVQSAIGPLQVHSYMSMPDENAADSNLVYGIVETSYPKKWNMNSSPNMLKSFFEGVIDGTVKSLNGKLMSQKDIKWKDIPGKEITVNYGDSAAIVTMRFYLKESNLVALETIALPGKEVNQNAGKFFNSLEIK